MYRLEIPMNNFGKTLTEALEARKMEIADLAQNVDSSREYIRQLTKGYVSPGKLMLKQICSVLNLDFPAMWHLVIEDKITKKYGEGVYTKLGKDPRFVEIERLLPQLTQEQFDFILGAVEGIAKRNRIAAPAPAHIYKAKSLALTKQHRQSKQSKTVHPGVLKREAANEVKR
jgi:transcriptional regulator with XRE-family HTH domain